jgi:hypothetical protein
VKQAAALDARGEALAQALARLLAEAWKRRHEDEGRTSSAQIDVKSAGPAS